MTFLKPEQVDTSLLDSEDRIPVAYLLQATDLTPATQEDDCVQAILTALDQDPQVGPYLPQIRDPSLPRSIKDAPFLQPFSTDAQGRVLYKG